MLKKIALFIDDDFFNRKASQLCMLAIIYMLSLSAHSNEVDTSSVLPAKPSILNLFNINARYDLAALATSNGFVPKDQTVNANTIDAYDRVSTYGLNPDFSQHGTYQLHTKIHNNSGYKQWVLHVSNFGFTKVSAFLISKDKKTTNLFNNQNRVRTNSIGQAVELTLQPNTTYLLVVELSSDHTTWYPYIGLMTRSYYQQWDMKMDYAFNIAIGIILAMIILGIFCWLIMYDSPFLWASVSSLLLLIYYLEHSRIPLDMWGYDYTKGFEFWLLMSLKQASLLAFAASFLQLKKQQGRLYRTFLYVGIFTAFVLVISPFLSFKINAVLHGINYILVLGVIVVSGVIKVCTDSRFYIIYLLGWLPIVLSLLHVIYYFSVGVNDLDTISVSYKMIAVLYIHILHMLLHAIAMIQRVRTLRLEKHEAERLSQAKSQFIAHSSHDMYQPLHAMHLSMQSLKPHLQSLDAQAAYHRIENAHAQISHAFKSVMDLKKLEAGVIKADKKPVHLGRLLATLEPEMRELTSRKHLRFRIRKPDVWVGSDPDLLLRIMRNLIVNAITYTDYGHILVGARMKQHEVVLQVLDTGRGMSDEFKTQAFDIYQRANRTPEHGKANFGIGLSIVKHLSQLLEHPVKVKSTLDKGTVFSLTLQKKDNHTKLEHENKKPLTPRIALLIDDHEVRHEIEQLLARWQCLHQSFDFNDLPSDKDWALICDHKHHHLFSSHTYLAIACVGQRLNNHDNCWTRIDYPIIPAQLRAFLNYIERSMQHKPTRQT